MDKNEGKNKQSQKQDFNNSSDKKLTHIAQLSSQVRYLSNKVNQLNSSIIDIKNNIEESDDSGKFKLNVGSGNNTSNTQIICSSILLLAILIAVVIITVFAPHATIVLLLHQHAILWIAVIFLLLGTLL